MPTRMEMNLLDRLRASLWTGGIGVIGLSAFAVAPGGVGPPELAGLTGVLALVAGVLTADAAASCGRTHRRGEAPARTSAS